MSRDEQTAHSDEAAERTNIEGSFPKKTMILIIATFFLPTQSRKNFSDLY